MEDYFEYVRVRDDPCQLYPHFNFFATGELLLLWRIMIRIASSLGLPHPTFGGALCQMWTLILRFYMLLVPCCGRYPSFFDPPPKKSQNHHPYQNKEKRKCLCHLLFVCLQIISAHRKSFAPDKFAAISSCFMSLQTNGVKVAFSLFLDVSREAPSLYVCG